MSDELRLRIDGEVDTPQQLTFHDLAAMPPECQIANVTRGKDKVLGDGVLLSAILQRIGARPAAQYIGLHSTLDDFHASIPLGPLRERAVLVYRLDGKPLQTSQGGPFRFFIPDHAACHTDEIDECANVKFIDHIELTATKGFDNRPQDDEEHEKLHQQ